MLNNKNIEAWEITNKGLEASTLTSTGLFLDRHDLENFIFQGRAQEEVNNFKLLEYIPEVNL